MADKFQTELCTEETKKTVKLSGSGLFATFKTQEELRNYIESHSVAEERRLLWLGVMFGSNYVAHQVNETFDLTYKKDKKCPN
jgi:hypothetical protein